MQAIIGIIVGALLVVLLLSFGMAAPAPPALPPPPALPTAGPTATAIASFVVPDHQQAPAVQDRLQGLGVLETASLRAQRSITVGDAPELQRLFMGEAITLDAIGVIVAGLDASKIVVESVDVTTTHAAVTISLPESVILHRYLDETDTDGTPEFTRVAQHSLGWFSDNDPALGEQARMAAISAITRVACEQRITERAAEEAKTRITNLLAQLGFTQITVNAPAGACQP